MADKEGKRPYSALTDAEDLSAGTDVAPDGDYSLEEILAEYGGGRRRRDANRAAAREGHDEEAARGN